MADRPANTGAPRGATVIPFPAGRLAATPSLDGPAFDPTNPVHQRTWATICALGRLAVAGVTPARQEGR